MRGMGMLASEILIGGQAGRNWMCVCDLDKHGLAWHIMLALNLRRRLSNKY